MNVLQNSQYSWNNYYYYSSLEKASEFCWHLFTVEHKTLPWSTRRNIKSNNINIHLEPNDYCIYHVNIDLCQMFFLTKCLQWWGARRNGCIHRLKVCKRCVPISDLQKAKSLVCHFGLQSLAYSQLPRKYKIYSPLRKYRQLPLGSSLFTLICANDGFGFNKLCFHHCWENSTKHLMNTLSSSCWCLIVSAW